MLSNLSGIHYDHFFKNYMSRISFLALLVVLWQVPTTMHAISVILLSVSLTIAFSFTIKKHRGAYLQNKITRDVFVRNVLVEIFGILLAMALAALLDRYISQIVTGHISNDLTKLIAGIVIGLLVGVGIGLLVKRVWGSFVKI